MIMVAYLRLVMEVDDDAALTRDEFERQVLASLDVAEPLSKFPKKVWDAEGEEVTIDVSKFEIIPAKDVKLQDFEPPPKRMAQVEEIRRIAVELAMGT